MKPYINTAGTLVIPFDSDQKYWWWAGGQSIGAILVELNAPPGVTAKYVPQHQKCTIACTIAVEV